MSRRQIFNSHGAFATSPPTFIDKWMELDKLIIPLQPDSLLQVGIGDQLNCEKWNSMFADLYPIQYFVNIDIDRRTIDRARSRANPFLKNSEECDVKDIDNKFDDDSFDIVFWSHGPEHVERGEWKDIFPKLEKVAKKAVILQCPWGNGYDKDPAHLSKSIREDEFKTYGYEVLSMGVEDTMHANLLAYKVV